MIFVDTSAWFSAFVPNDKHHDSAASWLKNQANRDLLTTDYVVDELLTLLKFRNESQRALVIGNAMFSESMATLEFVSPDDVATAWEIFRKHQDKKWSFTDCASLAVIKRLKITTAFAFDDDFRQFGDVTVVPA